MRKKISEKELQRLRTPEFIRLFWYAKKVSKFLGKRRALRLLEQFVMEKRLAWLKENRGRIKRVKGPPLDRAYKIFYEMNQRLDPQEMKIVKKDENTLITRWFNYCPVLEACRSLGLDTREICKKVYHRPNQVFFSKINSRLRFNRNYKKIRPYAPYCEEVITLKDG